MQAPGTRVRGQGRSRRSLPPQTSPRLYTTQIPVLMSTIRQCIDPRVLLGSWLSNPVVVVVSIWQQTQWSDTS